MFESRRRWMTPRDAVRLLLAVAGSQFVKNSKMTLDGFRKLQPIRHARRQSESGERPATLEDHLARSMGRLIAARDQLPTEYVRDARGPKHGTLALTLISAATAGARDAPRVAIARHYTEGSAGAVSFATPGWATPVISEAEYALAVPETGLIYSRHVTTWAFAEIALSL